MDPLEFYATVYQQNYTYPFIPSASEIVEPYAYPKGIAKSKTFSPLLDPERFPGVIGISPLQALQKQSKVPPPKQKYPCQCWSKKSEKKIIEVEEKQPKSVYGLPPYFLKKLIELNPKLGRILSKVPDQKLHEKIDKTRFESTYTLKHETLAQWMLKNTKPIKLAKGIESKIQIAKSRLQTEGEKPVCLQFGKTEYMRTIDNLGKSTMVQRDKSHIHGGCGIGRLKSNWYF